jgi:hypothetical protein
MTTTNITNTIQNTTSMTTQNIPTSPTYPLNFLARITATVALEVDRITVENTPVLRDLTTGPAEAGGWRPVQEGEAFVPPSRQKKGEAGKLLRWRNSSITG